MKVTSISMTPAAVRKRKSRLNLDVKRRETEYNRNRNQNTNRIPIIPKTQAQLKRKSRLNLDVKRRETEYNRNRNRKQNHSNQMDSTVPYNLKVLVGGVVIMSSMPNIQRKKKKKKEATLKKTKKRSSNNNRDRLIISGRMKINHPDFRTGKYKDWRQGDLVNNNGVDGTCSITWKDDDDPNNIDIVGLEYIEFDFESRLKSKMLCNKCGNLIDIHLRRCSACDNRCKNRDPKANRLSSQLYGNSSTDTAIVNDLITMKKYKNKFTAEHEKEARILIEDLYFNTTTEYPNQKHIVWNDNKTEKLEQTITQGDIYLYSSDGKTPSLRASVDVFNANEINNNDSIQLQATPPSEGLIKKVYPHNVSLLLLINKLDVISEQVKRISAEACVVVAAAAATINNNEDGVFVLKEGRNSTIYTKTNLSTDVGHNNFEEKVIPIKITEINSEQNVKLDEIISFIESHNIMEVLSSNCQGPGDVNENSIMFGVCSGQKRQEGISNRCGEYCTNDGILMTKLMKMINEYIQLTELVLQHEFPIVYNKLKRLKQLLSPHQVWDQNKWSMKSEIFSNGYISIGHRASRRHTDYKNSHLTHLTTRKLGNWENEVLTGQTILMDRYSQKVVVIQDSKNGKQLMGGLNAFAHANLSPKFNDPRLPKPDCEKVIQK